MSCVLVMSGHRSGSTMMVQILEELGVDMNPTSGEGTWEDLELQLMHESAIGDWQNPWPEFDGVRCEYRQHLEMRQKRARLWGFKDPRLCFLLPDVVDMIEHGLGETVYLINIYRHLVSSAKSLAVANPGMVQEDARTITEGYHTARMRSLKTYQGLRLDLNYDTIVVSPAKQVMRIANFLDVPITHAAIDVVDPEMRHHK